MAEGRRKLEINIPPQKIRAKQKGGFINEGGVISSEYGTSILHAHTHHFLSCPIKEHSRIPKAKMLLAMSFSIVAIWLRFSLHFVPVCEQML